MMQRNKTFLLCTLIVTALAMTVAGLWVGSDGTEVTTFVRGNQEVTRYKLTPYGFLGATLFAVGVALTTIMAIPLVLLCMKPRHQDEQQG